MLNLKKCFRFTKNPILKLKISRFYKIPYYKVRSKLIACLRTGFNWLKQVLYIHIDGDGGCAAFWNTCVMYGPIYFVSLNHWTLKGEKCELEVHLWILRQLQWPIQIKGIFQNIVWIRHPNHEKFLLWKTWEICSWWNCW